MLTDSEITALRHKVQHGERPIPRPTTTLYFTGGPLERLHVPVDAHSAGHPFIGWATITDTGCVMAEYRGEPGSLTRRFASYMRPGGNMKPSWA